MIKNYLTVAIRNLMRHKLYTAINVLGLAIGLACGILILLYIQQEFSVDRSHTLGDRIYKVIREERGSTQTTYDEGTSGALGPVLEETFPEVETTVRMWRWGVSAKYGDHKNLYTLALVDDNFLDVFDFPFIKGDPKTAFRTPYSAVITDDMAQHLFGDADPMGQTVSVDNRNFPGEYTVTGIVKAPHLLSNLQFHLLTTTIPSVEETQETWTMWRPTQSWRPVRTYVLLKAGQNAETLQTKMQSLIVQYMGDDVAKKNTYYLQPLHRVYLYGESDFNPAANSPIQQIYMLAAIGLILIVIACVNFTNLATARAVTRKREVGVRKVVGAHRPQLMVQFLTESLLLTCAALLIALALVELSLPLFNQFVRGDLHLDAIMVMAGAPAVLALTLLVGLLAGWYPAFFPIILSPGDCVKKQCVFLPWFYRAAKRTRSFSIWHVHLTGDLHPNSLSATAIYRNQRFGFCTRSHCKCTDLCSRPSARIRPPKTPFGTPPDGQTGLSRTPQYPQCFSTAIRHLGIRRPTTTDLARWRPHKRTDNSHKRGR